MLASLSQESEISIEGWTPGIQETPDTPDVNINFSVEPETFEEWSQAGLLPSLVNTVQSMEQGLDKANIAILGLHRDFSAMGGVMADTIHALDCRQQSLQTTVGKPRPVPGVIAGSLWEALSIMGQAPQTSGLDLSNLDVQARLGSLAAAMTATGQDVATLRVEKTALAADVQNLGQQLAMTLEIAIELWS